MLGTSQAIVLPALDKGGYDMLNDYHTFFGMKFACLQTNEAKVKGECFSPQIKALLTS